REKVGVEAVGGWRAGRFGQAALLTRFRGGVEVRSEPIEPPLDPGPVRGYPAVDRVQSPRHHPGGAHPAAFSDRTRPLASRTFRCWTTADIDMAYGRASSLTGSGPLARRRTMSRRPSSAHTSNIRARPHSRVVLCAT